MDAESVIALAVFQFPSCETDPESLSVCPYDVVLITSKVTATVAKAEQAVDVFEVVVLKVVPGTVVVVLVAGA